MVKKKDLDITNQRFGNLVVLDSNKEIIKSHTFCLCKCDCGNEKLIRKYCLLSHKVNSCGCKEGFQVKLQFLAGDRFGKLTIVEYLHGKAAYKCVCLCGTEIITSSSQLKRGRIVCCGSIRCRVKQDIVGKRFGRLIVHNDFYYKQVGKCKRSYVKVVCDCGNEKYVIVSALLSGDTTSCGCYKKQRINEAYSEYRISKGYKPNEHITPIVLAARAQAVSTGINKQILSRDEFKCQLCNNVNTTTNPLQVHHIIPISVQLENHANPSNLITLCSTCHLEKAHSGKWATTNKEVAKILQSLVELKLSQ